MKWYDMEIGKEYVAGDDYETDSRYRYRKDVKHRLWVTDANKTDWEISTRRFSSLENIEFEEIKNLPQLTPNEMRI